MNHVDIKPLSINTAWQGKRYKTQKYKDYRLILTFAKLPDNLFIPQGDLLLVYEFGVSNNASDVDNLVKPFQDALQDKYGFNDSRIKSFIATKKKVKKGQEYIKFDIIEHKFKAFEEWAKDLEF